MTYFVCDVETGNVFPLPGALLTVGFVVIQDGEIQDHFYEHVAYEVGNFDKDTIEWWNEQAFEVQEEAFNWAFNRLHPISLAVSLNNWVTKYEPNKSDAIFVANPSTFDYGWINMLFKATDVPNPFSHRTLCLRSMRFGKEGGEYGLKREGYESEMPHHAMYDAIAAANDLLEML